MIEYLAILLALTLIIIALWLIQPYKNWKKNFDARQYEPISITDRTRTRHTLAEYLQAVDKQT
jgi:hypothetical protein